MKLLRAPRRVVLWTGISLLLIGLFAPTARAEFGIHDFDVAFDAESGAGQALAGTHPFAMTTSFAANLEDVGGGEELPEDSIKDLEAFLLPGFIGDQTAVPQCSTLDFLLNTGPNTTSCANSAVVGEIHVEVSETGGVLTQYSPVYNLSPPPGTVARFGFFVQGTPVTLSASLSEEPPYEVLAHTRNISQVLEFYAAEFTLWGVPADERHDPLRGDCLGTATGGSLGKCPAGVDPRPFLTLPRACQGPLKSEYATDSWQSPGPYLPDGQPDLSSPLWVQGFALTHDDADPPNPQGMLGCGGLSFAPTIDAAPTTRAAESSTGLDFSLDVEDEGLKSAKEGARAASDIRKAVVTLPEGMTANPSSAEGLEVCTEAQLDGEGSKAAAGVGCPDASKLGTIEVQSPLIDQTLNGSLYLAEPYQNPFGTLIALYMVFRNEELGIFVKQPLKVEADPNTGQLVTTAEEIPQLPFSHFKLHFREGARSPLVSPPACGTYQVKALLYPWSGGAPVESTSSFEIVAGVNEGPCPRGGTPPFSPGFEAGSANNRAGAFSPFYMRLTRRDGDQDLTRFSAKLPPGMVAKLAGTTQCPDSAIAQARSRTGQSGGAQEQATPSCPASSRIGRVMAGAGVGSILTYVPGNLYLAGPYKGAPLSVVAIVPALAGPFDAGTVVTQEALRINPLTAEVEADGSSSDPIPHILKGIPLKVRDVRVYVDKPDFTLNPTSCEPFEVGASIWGGGQNVFSALDDSPLFLASRFQAADCAGLAFKPNLLLKLKGGTKRGSHPALTGTYTPRRGDANLAGLILRLPRSAFLDQAHIRTICTRVQFAANGGNGAGCPAGAIYGYATAYTPILDEPLSGPVFLRSSNHNLPDFVAALHGLIDVEAVARIDSKNGGIRATFPFVPDAPLSKVVVRMQGAKKGLIVNSTDLCQGKHKVTTQFLGQNGKRYEAKPTVKSDCAKKRHKKNKRSNRRTQSG